LLIEEQRTNLLLRSEEFDNASWTKSATTVSANSTTAPDGTTTADKLVEDSTNSGHSVFQNTSVVSGTTYTMSGFFKKGERNFGWLKFADGATNWGRCFNLNTGQVGNVVSGFTAPTASTITDVGNGWFRCTITMTAGASGTGGHDMGVMATDGTRVYLGTGTSGIYIWGAQLEAGAFATSYIPTVASQVTRAADSASMIGNNFARWYTQGVGTLYAESQFLVPVPASTNHTIASLSDGTTTNFLAMRYAAGTSQTSFVGVTAGATQWLFNNGTNLTAGTFSKNALAYNTNDIAGVVNAGTVNTDATAIIPVVSQMVIGGAAGATQLLNAPIKRITYYPRRLANTELTSITS
jgi:hypothetical protein